MSDEWIIVRNWDRFQHYRDRNPAWIKMYVELLDDPAYMGLTTHARCLLHGVWMMFARSRGVVPMDTRWLGHKLSMKVTMTHLESLNHAGFIGFSASKPLASCYQTASPHARPRARGEVEKDKERPSSESQHHQPQTNGPRRGLTTEDAIRWVERVGHMFEPPGFNEELAGLNTTPEAREAAQARYHELHPT